MEISDFLSDYDTRDNQQLIRGQRHQRLLGVDLKGHRLICLPRSACPSRTRRLPLPNPAPNSIPDDRSPLAAPQSVIRVAGTCCLEGSNEETAMRSVTNWSESPEWEGVHQLMRYTDCTYDMNAKLPPGFRAVSAPGPRT